MLILDHHLKCDSRNEHWHSHHSQSHLVLNATLNTEKRKVKKKIYNACDLEYPTR